MGMNGTMSLSVLDPTLMVLEAFSSLLTITSVYPIQAHRMNENATVREEIALVVVESRIPEDLSSKIGPVPI